MKPVDVRAGLVDALRLDLVGPNETVGDLAEVLPQSPSRWYLTGFLAPLDSGSQRADETSNEELELGAEPGGADEDVPPEPAAARQRLFPSSIGITALVPAAQGQLHVTVSWGNYHRRSENPEEWQREKELPNSAGLMVAYLGRPIGQLIDGAELPPDTRAISIFVVNRRTPAPDDRKDEAFAFQVCLEVATNGRFLARPDLRSLASADWDDRVADIQYRDAGEFAVGHNVANQAVVEDGTCRVVRTCWIPQAEVERLAPAAIPGVKLRMDELAALADVNEAKAALNPLVTGYRDWIDEQRASVPQSPARRRDTGNELLQRATIAADRIQRGIHLLGDPQCLEAFRIANRAMAEAARRRLGVMQGKAPDSVQPAWRPFQLAFILMNLAGLADGANPERGIVDLLFFPTGGGKTEAYLGLAAFTLVLRRLRNPGIRSAGLSVLMRYHAPPPHTRSAQPGIHPHLRSRTGAAERRRKTG